jgi:CRISPR-associated protein (TIGR03986 family)
MAKGKIDFLKPEGKFGFIRSETGQRIHFPFRVLGKSVRSENLYMGMEVEFDFVQAERGPTATRVEVFGIEAKPEVGETETSENGKGYRFLNPYNFVRFLTSVDKKSSNGNPPTAFASALLAAGITTSPTEKTSQVDLDLLGKCPPPPHDRWVGLNGKIICHAVAETPIFISDNEGVAPHPKEKDHKIYRQFEYHCEAAIPASSLRGMIRNVFEAITNSCFAHFTGNRRLSYHLPAGEAPYLIPARVKHEKKDAPWELELLTGTTPLVIHQRPRGPQYAAWLRAWPRPVIGLNPEARYPRDDYGKRPVIDFPKDGHKNKVWARLRKYKHPRASFEFWNVEELADKQTAFENVASDELVTEGFLCLTYQNIERKHDERFFFRVPENTTGPKSIDLPKLVREAYEDLIVDYQSRHEKEVEKRGRENAGTANYKEKESAFSRFVLNPDEKELSHGDLVYAWLEGPVSKPQVKFLAPVSVPRVSFENRVGDLLPIDLHKCKKYEELCPACRLFGWVNDGEDTNNQKAPQACVGRLRFQHASLLNKPTLLPEETLGILSTPKPTTIRFYLVGADRHPSRTLGLNGAEGVPLTEEEAGYDTFKRPRLEDGKEEVKEYVPLRFLRGRKFYRHQSNGRMAQDLKLSDQNRTIRNALPKGTELAFEVTFENLSKIELGALLWALEMPDHSDEAISLFHRLGYGKPLGLGSLQISIQSVKWLEHQKRHTSLAEFGWVEIEPEQWKSLQIHFEKVMADKYGAESFGGLPHVLDLKALLGAFATDLPVHYPRPTKEPDPDEHPSYEWFVGNKRDKGPKFELPLAADDTVGLPLVDKEGKWS